MTLPRIVRVAVVCLACVGMLTAQFAHAAGDRILPVRDLALHDGGVLVGQVLDAQGAPQAGVQVQVISQGKVVAAAVTGADGVFRVPHLSGGVYQLLSPAAVGSFRAWAPGSAPPSALSGALLVSGGQVIRGNAENPILQTLTNPIVLGGIVCTGIFLPLALDDGNGS